MKGFRTGKRAFTLVELIVVVIVLGILLAVVLANFFGASNAAKDSSVKQYLTVSYKVAAAQSVGNNNAWPNPTSLQGALASSEPQLSSPIGDCVSAARAPSATVVTIDQLANGGANTLLYGHSGSGRTFQLYATHASGPLISEAACGLSSSGVRIGSTSGNSAVPAVSGTAQVGLALSASDGSWGFGGPQISKTWYACAPGWGSCSVIGSGASYTLVSGDLGRNLAVLVTASDPANGEPHSIIVPAYGGGGDGSIGPSLPVSNGPPAISGTAAQGETLNASTGSWSGIPSSYTYKWTWADTTSRQNGASASYLLLSGDVGKTLTVTVTASNTFGSSSAASSPTATVTGPVAPVFTSGPTIVLSVPISYTYAPDGKPSQSSTAASPSGLTLTNVWWACDSAGANCSNIGSTAPTADCAHTYKVVVTATNSTGTTTWTSATSLPASCDQIVYTTATVGSHIYRMNGDGTGSIVDLTPSASNTANGPKVSSDGTKVVYVLDNNSSSHLGIWMMNIDGTDQHLVTTGDRADLLGSGSSVDNPTWSPDGTQIAYTDVARRLDPPTTGSAIYYTSIFTIAASTRNDTHGGTNGGNALPQSQSTSDGHMYPQAPSQLSWTNAGLFYVAYSNEFAWTCTNGYTPDGNGWLSGDYPNAVWNTYYYSNPSSSGGDGKLWPCGLTGRNGGTPASPETRYQTLWNGASQLNAITSKPSDAPADYWPQISPDGSTLLYVHTSTAGTALRLRNMSSGVVTTIPGATPNTSVPVRWSRDGTMILFKTSAGSRIIALDGTCLRSTDACSPAVPYLTGIGSLNGWDWGPPP